MTLRPGQLDRFKRQAIEYIRSTQEKDTGTLRYNWFRKLGHRPCPIYRATQLHREHISGRSSATFRGLGSP